MLLENYSLKHRNSSRKSSKTPCNQSQTSNMIPQNPTNQPESYFRSLFLVPKNARKNKSTSPQTQQTSVIQGFFLEMAQGTDNLQEANQVLHRAASLRIHGLVELLGVVKIHRPALRSPRSAWKRKKRNRPVVALFCLGYREKVGMWR